MDKSRHIVPNLINENLYQIVRKFFLFLIGTSLYLTKKWKFSIVLSLSLLLPPFIIYTRDIQYFCPWWCFANWCIIQICCTSVKLFIPFVSEDKIQYRYDHLFAHRMSLHKHTLMHCCFNMRRKQDKNPGNSGVYFDSTLSSCISKYHIGRSFL